MKTTLILLLVFFGMRPLLAQIPVTDVASITNNTIAHVEDIAKWVESINSLKTQINHSPKTSPP